MGTVFWEVAGEGAGAGGGGGCRSPSGTRDIRLFNPLRARDALRQHFRVILCP